jgi:hypothetical protein
MRAERGTTPDHRLPACSETFLQLPQPLPASLGRENRVRVRCLAVRQQKLVFTHNHSQSGGVSLEFLLLIIVINELSVNNAVCAKILIIMNKKN